MQPLTDAFLAAHHPTPLALTAGESNHWTLTVTVDGVRQTLTGKQITVDGWVLTEDAGNGATASGSLLLIP